MIEKDVEQRLVDKVKELGGKCYKFVSPGNAGVPDRIVVCNGYTVFVELKKPEDYKFAKLQKVHRDEIHRNGGFCILIKNYEEVDKFVEILKKGRTHELPST